MVIAASQLIGQPLPLPLELNASQHMVRKIPGIYSYQNSGICHPAIPMVIAHAVGDNSTNF